MSGRRTDAILDAIAGTSVPVPDGPADPSRRDGRARA